VVVILEVDLAFIGNPCSIILRSGTNGGRGGDGGNAGEYVMIPASQCDILFLFTYILLDFRHLYTGHGSSGANGGNGGLVELYVTTNETYLLMSVEDLEIPTSIIHKGTGGQPGKHGFPGR
jgi:hypothetical protein